MQSIVPIIGHEFVDARPPFKKRLESLLHLRGFQAHWIDQENITSLEQATHAEISIPIIIDLIEKHDQITHPDLLFPLLEHFRSAIVIVEQADLIPEILFQLQPQLSLWESLPPAALLCLAIKYIYHHLSKAELGVEEIAHENCVSKYKLEREFKKWSGAGVWHFVKKARLSQAKRLLIESKTDISEIAYSVGYTDFPGFDKAFKKTYHVTPHVFRKQMKDVAQNDKFIYQND